MNIDELRKLSGIELVESLNKSAVKSRAAAIETNGSNIYIS